MFNLKLRPRFGYFGLCDEMSRSWDCFSNLRYQFFNRRLIAAFSIAVIFQAILPVWAIAAPGEIGIPPATTGRSPVLVRPVLFTLLNEFEERLIVNRFRDWPLFDERTEEYFKAQLPAHKPYLSPLALMSYFSQLGANNRRLSKHFADYYSRSGIYLPPHFSSSNTTALESSALLGELKKCQRKFNLESATIDFLVKRCERKPILDPSHLGFIQNYLKAHSLQASVDAIRCIFAELLDHDRSMLRVALEDLSQQTNPINSLESGYDSEPEYQTKRSSSNLRITLERPHLSELLTDNQERMIVTRFTHNPIFDASQRRFFASYRESHGQDPNFTDEHLLGYFGHLHDNDGELFRAFERFYEKKGRPIADLSQPNNHTHQTVAAEASTPKAVQVIIDTHFPLLEAEELAYLVHRYARFPLLTPNNLRIIHTHLPASNDASLFDYFNAFYGEAGRGLHQKLYTHYAALIRRYLAEWTKLDRADLVEYGLTDFQSNPTPSAASESSPSLSLTSANPSVHFSIHQTMASPPEAPELAQSKELPQPASDSRKRKLDEPIPEGIATVSNGLANKKSKIVSVGRPVATGEDVTSSAIARATKSANAENGASAGTGLDRAASMLANSVPATPPSSHAHDPGQPPGIVEVEKPAFDRMEPTVIGQAQGTLHSQTRATLKPSLSDSRQSATSVAPLHPQVVGNGSDPMPQPLAAEQAGDVADPMDHEAPGSPTAVGNSDGDDPLYATMGRVAPLETSNNANNEKESAQAPLDPSQSVIAKAPRLTGGPAATTTDTPTQSLSDQSDALSKYRKDEWQLILKVLEPSQGHLIGHRELLYLSDYLQSHYSPVERNRIVDIQPLSNWLQLHQSIFRYLYQTLEVESYVLPADYLQEQGSKPTEPLGDQATFDPVVIGNADSTAAELNSENSGGRDEEVASVRVVMNLEDGNTPLTGRAGIHSVNHPPQSLGVTSRSVSGTHSGASELGNDHDTHQQRQNTTDEFNATTLYKLDGCLPPRFYKADREYNPRAPFLYLRDEFRIILRIMGALKAVRKTQRDTLGPRILIQLSKYLIHHFGNFHRNQQAEIIKLGNKLAFGPSSTTIKNSLAKFHVANYPLPQDYPRNLISLIEPHLRFHDWHLSQFHGANPNPQQIIEANTEGSTETTSRKNDLSETKVDPQLASSSSSKHPRSGDLVVNLPVVPAANSVLQLQGTPQNQNIPQDTRIIPSLMSDEMSLLDELKHSDTLAPDTVMELLKMDPPLATRSLQMKSETLYWASRVPWNPKTNAQSEEANIEVLRLIHQSLGRNVAASYLLAQKQHACGPVMRAIMRGAFGTLAEMLNQAVHYGLQTQSSTINHYSLQNPWALGDVQRVFGSNLVINVMNEFLVREIDNQKMPVELAAILYALAPSNSIHQVFDARYGCLSEVLRQVYPRKFPKIVQYRDSITRLINPMKVDLSQLSFELVTTDNKDISDQVIKDHTDQLGTSPTLETSESGVGSASGAV